MVFITALHCEDSSAEPGFLCVKTISNEECEHDTNSHMYVVLVTSSMFPVVNNVIPNFFFFFFFMTLCSIVMLKSNMLVLSLCPVSCVDMDQLRLFTVHLLFPEKCFCMLSLEQPGRSSLLSLCGCDSNLNKSVIIIVFG